MLQTIQKASDLLALFDQNHSEWGVREAAERLRMAKSSAHDLLASLAQAGFLSRTEAGRYRLGWRLVALSETLLGSSELRQVARPVMEELVEQKCETVHLALLDDTRVMYVDTVEGKQAVRVEIGSLGSRRYAHCSADGKVLLAGRTREEVARVVQAEGLPCFTPNTITDAGDLERALAKVRQQGYALDLEEFLQDLCCVGAPVYDHANQVVAAVSMCVPVYRFLRSQVELRSATVRAGKMISRKMGWMGG